MNLPNLTSEQITKLRQLAAAKGVQTSYHSAFGTELDASPEALVVALNALATDPSLTVAPDFSNLDAVIAAQSKEIWKTPSEPVWVAWEKKPLTIPVRVERTWVTKKAKGVLKIKLESGKTLTLPFSLAKLPTQAKAEFDGNAFVELSLKITKKLPFGYHSATLTVGKLKHSALIISAPWKAYKGKGASKKSLGVFAPLYAVHNKESYGIGDFTNLRELIEWAYSHGCDFVGTLPMLSIFTDKPVVEPSPYAPLSRVFWNELYVDPRKTAEWPNCREAQAITETSEFKGQVARLQANREVDHQAVAQLKRPVLNCLAQAFFGNPKNLKSKSYLEFLKLYPAAEDYAEFRATLETRNASWREWPESMKNGTITKGDYNEEYKLFHLYCQYQAHLQLRELSTYAAKKGRGTYIDFPLSAHADGYDVWRDRDSFAQVVSAGCPPDPAHVHGQDWGILALNPQSIRLNGYQYFRRCLESHMRYAGLLRLDHVMCFYRLYWVPHGLGAKKGVYVRYKMDEFFALLVLESHRNACTLIGEDLGTVPPEIREAMTAHGILRMYVQQRKLTPNPKEPLSEVPEGSICSLNTHDMPPFAAFWEGLDILDKMNLGYFGPEELDNKKKAREDAKAALVTYLVKKKFIKNDQAPFRDILKAMLRLTAKDPVKVMQINLEDIWQETLPQNVPGTWKERPNWKRRCRFGLEELPGPVSKTKKPKKGETSGTSGTTPELLADVPALLAELVQLRKKK